MDERKNIIRVEKNRDYTVINNSSLYDERLSWKAKAIHVFMLSKPDNWTFYYEEMMQWAKDGKDSFVSGMNELKKFGYVKKERRRVDGGKFDYITVVYEVPCQDTPQVDSPQTENPHTVEPPTDLPCTEKPSPGKPLTEKPLTENPPLISTNIPSTDSLSTKSFNNDDDNRGVPAPMPSPNPPQRPMNAFMFYEKNGFGVIGSMVAQKIGMWIDDLSEELVIRAMEIAVENNRLNWSYIETILKDWYQRKIRTLADVEADRLRFKAQRMKAQPAPRKTYGRTEQVPDWFNKHKEQAAASSDNISLPTEESIDFEAERQKILQKLGRA